MKKRVGYFLVLIAGLLAVATAFAGEPGCPSQYVNATSERITVYEDGGTGFTVEPHESRGIPAMEQYWTPNIKVVAEDGRVLLEDYITWDELKKMGCKIVITDPAAPVSQTPVASGGG